MRLGVHARGGVRARGTTTLPVLTGDVTTTGEMKAATLWATSLGAVGSPSIKMGDGDSGLYEQYDDAVSVASNGQLPMSWLGTSTVASGHFEITAGFDLFMGAGSQIFADPGTAALPGYSFVGDADSGFFRQGANTVGISCGGANTFASDGTNYFQVPSYFNGDARFYDLMAVPPAIANYFSLYATDVAGKVRSLIKLGATGNTVTLGTET